MIPICFLNSLKKCGRDSPASRATLDRLSASADPSVIQRIRVEVMPLCRPFDLPSLDALQSIEPSVKTVIFAANGDTLREFYTENRTIVPLSRIPPRCATARRCPIVAIEPLSL